MCCHVDRLSSCCSYQKESIFLLNMRLIFYIIISYFLGLSARGQMSTYPKDSLANCILMLRVDTVIDGKPSVITGTGIFIGKGEDTYIVTASHVAKAMSSKSSIIFKAKNDVPVKLNLNQLVTDGAIHWKNSEKADVAVLKIDPPQKFWDNGLFQNRFMPIALLYDSLKSISRETPLTVFGFPLGLGLDGFFSPLTYRSFPSSGLITLPRFDNGKLSSFILLENPSVGGYSGGPVFDMGLVDEGNIQFIRPKGTFCYGIVHGTISDLTGGKIAAITPAFYILELLMK